MHNKLLLFAGSLLLSTGAAAATTPPTSSPFTGIYGNLNAGWMYTGITNQQQSVIDLEGGSTFILSPSTVKLRSHSGTIGAGLGYAKSFKDRFILGIEGRAEYVAGADTNFKDTTTINEAIVVPLESSVKLRNDFAFLLKLGMLLQPNTLFYVVGGPAWANYQLKSSAKYEFVTSDVDITIVTASAKEKGYHTGWTAGVGMEYAFTQKVAAGLEYTYASYGDLDFPNESTSAPGNFVTNSVKFKNAQTNNVVLNLIYSMD